MKDTGYYVTGDKLDRLTTFYRYESGTLNVIETSDNSPYRNPPIGCSGGKGIIIPTSLSIPEKSSLESL